MLTTVPATGSVNVFANEGGDCLFVGSINFEGDNRTPHFSPEYGPDAEVKGEPLRTLEAAEYWMLAQYLNWKADPRWSD